MLKRPGGVTGKELMKATGWQPHSVCGFLSGTVGKKMGLTVGSSKGEDGERSYLIEGRNSHLPFTPLCSAAFLVWISSLMFDSSSVNVLGFGWLRPDPCSPAALVRVVYH